MAQSNEAQAHHWNIDAGPGWVMRQEQLDRMLEPFGLQAMAAAQPGAGERVVDIGCGCGATAIELARRVTPTGHVLGVDISEPMLARAGERAAELGLAHVDLLRADAQQTSLPAGNDLAFSRFGIMFFDDPVAALTNVARALRPGGRIAFVCWQARDRNPWMTIPIGIALEHVPAPAPTDPSAPGPFAFADPDRVSRILTEAGFVDPHVDGFEHALLVGGAEDLDGAAAFSADSGSVRTLLADADDATRSRVEQSIRTAFEPFVTPDGVRIESATWVVSAHLPE